MQLSKVVPSMGRVLVPFILMMFSAVEMNQDSLTAPTQANTTVHIQRMLESSAELNVSRGNMSVLLVPRIAIETD